jgi:hypothetical protein
MSMWQVRFVGRITPVTFRAENFVTAVAKAVEYANSNGIDQDAILSVDYLAY